MFNIQKDGEIGANAGQGDGEADAGMPPSSLDAADRSLRDMEPARLEIPSGSPMTIPHHPTGAVSSTTQASSVDEKEPRRLDNRAQAMFVGKDKPPSLSWPQPTVKLPEYTDQDEDIEIQGDAGHGESCPEQLPLPEAISVTPGSALKSFGSDTDIPNDMPTPQIEAQFPSSALGSTDSHLPTNSFGSTTTDYDAMYPQAVDFTDMQNMAMAQAPFMGIPPHMYLAGPQMWAPYGHVPPHMFGGFPGVPGAVEGGDDSLQSTAEDLEQKATELMAVARRMKQTARQQARWSGSVASSAGSQRGSLASMTGEAAAGASKGRQAALSQTLEMQDDDKTTVMLRNLPNDYKRDMLLNLLDSEGFVGRYNFVYLPMDFKRMAGLGYAFVNMETPEDAQEAWKHFVGFQNWTLQSQKICEVAWGEPLQGLDAHIERYRNSPVMHEDVPEEFKPVLFKQGQRSPFPEPTKRIRPPRMKYRTPAAEGRESRASTADAVVMAPAAAGSAGPAGGGSEGGGATDKFVD